MISGDGLRLVEHGDGWALAGTAVARFDLVNEYLGYLADRNYSPKTVRAYGYDLLAFCRWLDSENVDLAGVTTEVLLGFLHACREASVPGRPGPNVVRLSGRRLDRYSATTINRRLAAISGFVHLRRDAGPVVEEPGAEGSRGPLAHLGRAQRDAVAHGPPAEEPFLVAAARAATVTDRPVTAGGCRAVGQLPNLAGPRDRRADAVLRSPLG
jgi:hypothetical protein